MPMTIRSSSTKTASYSPIALQEMPRPSLISVSRFMTERSRAPASPPARTLLHRRDAPLDPLVTGDEPVADADDSARVSGHVFFMRHHENGVPFLRKFIE